MTPQDFTDETCALKAVHPERLEKARQESLTAAELDRLALTFKVLGDPTRLRIIMALTASEMCVCDLADLVELTDSAVSHQLRRLKDLALVRSKREGQMIFYALDDDHVAGLLRLGLDHVRE